MFYGRLKTKEERQYFRQALARFRTFFGTVHAADNVILFDRTLGFLKDEAFAGAMERHARNPQEKSLSLRLNTLVWAASQALHVPGDFAECGVYRGFSMAVVADYLKFERIERTLFLYDTFAGIPSEFDWSVRITRSTMTKGSTPRWSSASRATRTCASSAVRCR